MKKNQETTQDSDKFSGDVLTGICTVGVLPSDISKALDVDDAVMVVVIDKKNQKHLRVSFPTKTLRDEHHDDRLQMNLPRLEQESPGCWWLTEYGKIPGGDKTCLYKRCVAGISCPRLHEVIDLGPG